MKKNEKIFLFEIIESIKFNSKNMCNTKTCIKEKNFYDVILEEIQKIKENDHMFLLASTFRILCRNKYLNRHNGLLSFLVISDFITLNISNERIFNLIELVSFQEANENIDYEILKIFNEYAKWTPTPEIVKYKISRIYIRR